MEFFVLLYIIDCKEDRQFTVIIEGGVVLGWILFAAGIESLCKGRQKKCYSRNICKEVDDAFTTTHGLK